MLWRMVTPCRIRAMQMATGWLSRWMPQRLWTRRWKAPRLWARHRLHAFGIRNLIAQAVKTAGPHWVLAVKTAALHRVHAQPPAGQQRYCHGLGTVWGLPQLA